MINKTSIILTCISSLFIASCGGGGGDNSASNFEPLQITGDNAPEVVSAVFSSGTEDFTDFDVIGSSESSLTAISFNTQSFKTKSSVSFGPVAETIRDTTANCLIDGTVRISGEIASTDDVSAGDQLEFFFQNCSNDIDVTLDGSMGFVYREYEVRNFFDETIAIEISFDNFTTVTNTESIRLNGDIYTKIDSNSDKTDVTIRSEFIETRVNGEGVAWRDYHVDSTTDLSSFITTTNITGRLESDALGGYVDVETTSDLISDDGALPREGSMLITGNGKSSIMLTVLGDDIVELSVDEDGDGIEDKNFETTWSELQARL